MPEETEKWGARTGRCEQCGRENRPVDFVKDPFQRAGLIKDSGKFEWWCEDCFQKRNEGL